MELIDYNKVIEYSPKSEKVKLELMPFCSFLEGEFKLKKNGDTLIQHRVGMKMTQVLNKWRLLDEKIVEKMEADTLYAIYMDYLDLIVYLNQVIAYTPNKLEFCTFACITVADYNEMLISKNIDLRRQAKAIDADLINAAERSAESGASKEKSTAFRLKSKETGHEVKEVTKLEEAFDEMKEIAGAMYYERKLQSITNGKHSENNSAKK
jgi:hypothetical protein